MVFAATAIAALAPGLVACELGFPAGAEPHRELNRIDMANQPKLKPQRGDLIGVFDTGMLSPPSGSLAVDEHPYRYDVKEGDLAGVELTNPFPHTAKVIARGKWLFENVCIACHGPEAAGDGEVTTLFPKPPSLMTQRVRDWPDGRIFHVPMRGQGSMPSKAKVVTQDDIWHIIHYIRDLQSRLPVAPPPKPAGAKTQGGKQP
jgi:mono/diheme cytochrome c family protein